MFSMFRDYIGYTVPVSISLRDVAGANSHQGELPWDTTLRTSSTFPAASAVAGFASETQVRRGFQGGSRRRERTAGETRQEPFMSLRFRPEISRSAHLKRGPFRRREPKLFPTINKEGAGGALFCWLTFLSLLSLRLLHPKAPKSGTAGRERATDA